MGANPTQAVGIALLLIAFTLLAGRRKFAPRWMQRMGLTWLFRLLAEPLRLGPRYLKYNLLFLFYFLESVLRGRARESQGCRS